MKQGEGGGDDMCFRWVKRGPEEGGERNCKRKLPHFAAPTITPPCIHNEYDSSMPLISFHIKLWTQQQQVLEKEPSTRKNDHHLLLFEIGDVILSSGKGNM